MSNNWFLINPIWIVVVGAGMFLAGMNYERTASIALAFGCVPNDVLEVK